MKFSKDNQVIEIDTFPAPLLRKWKKRGQVIRIKTELTTKEYFFPPGQDAIALDNDSNIVVWIDVMEADEENDKEFFLRVRNLTPVDNMIPEPV